MEQKRKQVRLLGLPHGFLDDLPQGDRRALLDAVGTQVKFNGFDEHGRAELEFKDKNGARHFIYLDPELELYTEVE